MQFNLKYGADKEEAMVRVENLIQSRRAQRDDAVAREDYLEALT